MKGNFIRCDICQMWTDEFHIFWGKHFWNKSYRLCSECVQKINEYQAKNEKLVFVNLGCGTGTVCSTVVTAYLFPGSIVSPTPL